MPGPPRKFLERIKDLFKRPVKRDVSRLESADSADIVEEVVDTTGGPLKEGHLRRAMRDRRLLPKRKPTVYIGKKKRYLSTSDAARLFSGTMRNRDRNIRDLLPDEDQLERYGLPIWQTEEDLADDLEITVEKLRHYSIHREKETCPHYVTFEIPKRNGDRRRIMAPKKKLKALQRQVQRQLVDRLPVSDRAHGFRAGRSIKTGAEPHVGRAVVVHLDLKDFFPSIHFGRVRGMLVSLGYGYPVATTLAVLMTEAVRQPVVIEGQTFYVPVGPRHTVAGAPTSPGLSNAVCLRLDRRLAGLARSIGYTYTRYADDLSFSGDDPGRISGLLHLADKIIKEEGFEINPEKTRVMRRGRRQSVTGVVVNETLGISRKERRKIRAMIHQAAGGVGTMTRHKEAVIKGKLAYLHMLNPEQAKKLRGDRF